jgi:hypothetical protein
MINFSEILRALESFPLQIDTQHSMVLRAKVLFAAHWQKAASRDSLFTKQTHSFFPLLLQLQGTGKKHSIPASKGNREKARIEKLKIYGSLKFCGSDTFVYIVILCMWRQCVHRMEIEKNSKWYKVTFIKKREFWEAFFSALF